MGQPTGKGGGTGASSAASDSAVKLAESINAEISPVRGELTSQFLEALKTGGVGAQIPIIQRSIEANRLATQGALDATRLGTTQALNENTAATRAAVSQTQSGAGRANTDVMSQLAAGGLTGTPFAARVAAETATAGRSAVAQLLAQREVEAGRLRTGRAITESDLTAQRAAYEATLPTDIAQSFISGAPAYSLGQTQQAFTGFGQGSQFQLGNAGIQSQRDIAKSGELTKIASLGK